MKKQIIGYSAIALAVIFLDRVSKVWLISTAYNADITSFLSISPFYNKGISWGLGNGIFSSFFLIINGIGILSVLAFYTYHSYRAGKSVIGEVLILSGALSNIIDRVLWGAVFDFILVHYGNWHFPVFNLADVAITCGAGWMIWHYIHEQ